METQQERKNSKTSSNGQRPSPFFSPIPVQTKLKVNEPGDKFEQEADSVSEQVVAQLSEASTNSAPSTPPSSSRNDTSQSDSGISHLSTIGKSSAVTVGSFQAKCDTCDAEEMKNPKEEEIQRIPESKISLQANAGDDQEESSLIARHGSSFQPTVSDETARQLYSSKGSGDPLPKIARSEMERSFGEDFSHVRVHTDSAAQKMSKNLGAKAFTHGSDIYFNSGNFETSSQEGKKLLAHELTHTVQQNDGAAIQRFEGEEDEAVESEGTDQIFDFSGDGAEPFATAFLQNFRLLRPEIFEESDIRVVVQLDREGVVFFNESGEQLCALIPINFLVRPGIFKVVWSTSGPILYPLNETGHGTFQGSIVTNAAVPSDFYEYWNFNSTFLIVPDIPGSGGGSSMPEEETQREDPEERPPLPVWADELNRVIQNHIRQLRTSPETNPDQAISLPDRVVIWINRHGDIYLNIWVDQAVRPIRLNEEDSEETAMDRIIETVRQIESERDPSESHEVVDGVEQTGFEPDDTQGANGNPAQVQQGAILTDEQLTSPDSTANAIAYGAEIISYDLANDEMPSLEEISGPDFLVAVLGANNRMSMQLDFSIAGARLIDQVGARMQYIRYYWEVIDVTGLNPIEREEGVDETVPGQGEMINPLSGELMRFGRDMEAIQEDTEADLNEMANDPYLFVTWPQRAAYLELIGLSNGIRVAGSVISSYLNLLTTPSNEIDIGWGEPGEFIIRCVASPVYEEDSQVRRASSVAVKAVRVVNIHERATLLVDKELTDLDRLYDLLDSASSEEERHLLLTQISELERIQSQSAVERASEQLGQVEVQLNALNEIEGRTGTEGLSPSARLLRVQLELTGITATEMRDHLSEQRRVLSRMRSYGRRQEADMIQSYRPRVVLVSEENGASYQLIMILGESTDSEDGAYHFKLIDLTSPATQDEYEGSSSGEGMSGKNEALRNAFVNFRERNGYGRGTIAIRLPEDMPRGLTVETTMRSAPGSRDRALRRLQDLATAAEIAGLVISGPVGIGIGLAGGAAGAIIAGEHLWRRHRADRFDWDFATFMDISAIVGGAIPFLGMTSRRMGSLVYYVGVAQLGQSVLVIPIQLEQQLRQIEMDTTLSPGERSARRAEAFLQAVRSGVVTTISAAQMLEHGPPVSEGNGESATPAELPEVDTPTAPEIDSPTVHPDPPSVDNGAAMPGIPVETEVSPGSLLGGEVSPISTSSPEIPVVRDIADPLVRELVLHRDRIQQQLDTLRRSSPEATLLGLEIADINEALEGLRMADEDVANAADLDRNAIELLEHLRSIDDSATAGDRIWETDPMPDATVMQDADPTDSFGSNLMYTNSIANDPLREAAIYRNNETNEYIIVQGEERMVSVGDGEGPLAGGRQQAWKELLNEGQDRGSWELEAHYHPLSPESGEALYTNRIPSGGSGDIGVIVLESITAGGNPRSSRIDFRLPDGTMEYTMFSFIPGVENPIIVDIPLSYGSRQRSRLEFASVEAYHEWASDQLGGADMGSVPTLVSETVLGSRVTEGSDAPRSADSEIPSISSPGESITPRAAGTRRGTETVAARAERLAREQSMMEYDQRRQANGGRESITDFARHGQTFNSILQTLRNVHAALASSGRGELLPQIREEVLQQTIDHFILQNTPLMEHLSSIIDTLRQSPNGARNSEGWLTIRDSLLGGDDALLNYLLTGRYQTRHRGGIGSRLVGARIPDLVTFDLENGIVQVIDWTTDIVGANTPHNLKTHFYIEVMRALLGNTGPAVSGRDVRIQLDSSGHALDHSLTVEGPLIE